MTHRTGWQRAILTAMAAALAIPPGGPIPAPVEAAARIQRVYPLAPAEGVFAYSRISPDGTQLAYTSEAPPSRPGARPVRTVRVVDLATRRITFEHLGMDAYWSPDGRRLIFLRFGPDVPDSVCILTVASQVLACDVASPAFGDYFSWARQGGRDLILTISSMYYYLEGARAVMPPGRVVPCPGIGVGARPLISKDGRQVTTFASGTIVVRNVTDCDGIVRTNLGGSKADFSWDGRYIAFHAQKPRGDGHEIRVVDLVRRRTFVLGDLPGSSFFPSWTQDGRLSFRYDSEDFRGFVIASDFMTTPSQPLPTEPANIVAGTTWRDIFPAEAAPPHAVNIVLVWAPWNAHSPDALIDLQAAADGWAARRADVGVFTAAEPSSIRSDVSRMQAATAVRLQELVLQPDRVVAAGAENYVPMVLLFAGDRLYERRLGAQTPAMLDEMIRQALIASGNGAAE